MLEGSLSVKNKDFFTRYLSKSKYLLLIFPLWVVLIALFFIFDVKITLFFNVLLSLVLSVLIFILVVFFGYLYVSNKSKSKTLSVTKTLNTQFAKRFDYLLKLQKKKKYHKSFYDESVYLFLTINIEKERKLLSQMSYELFLSLSDESDEGYPIECWVSPHSIIVCVETSEALTNSHIENLCSSINRRRKRQAINGIILASEIEYLIDNHQDLYGYTDKIRNVIHKCNDDFGLNAPVYNIFTDLSTIDNLCQFFSTFDQQDREDPLGAMMPMSQSNGIDLEWVKTSFDELTSKLMDSLSQIINRQLTPNLRQSIAAGPFQFSLLKPYVITFLNQLYHDDNYHVPLKFRGYFFVNSTSSNESKDLLADIIVKKVSGDKYYRLSKDDFAQPLFTQSLIPRVILPENTLVGVNPRRENTFIFGQAIYGLFCGALWVAVLALLKMSFDFQNERELMADEILKKYKESILISPYNVQNFPHNVPNLLLLEQINDIFSKDEPWYSLSLIPDSNISDSVAFAYNDALKHVLLPSMLYDLQQDLFVASTLKQKNTSLSLLNIYNHIDSHQGQALGDNIINGHFINELRAEGQNDPQVLSSFSDLIIDVAQMPKTDNEHYFNDDLLMVAQTEVGKVGVEYLVYQRIKELPKFSREIDLRESFGSKFSQLFEFNKGFSGYLVPYMFTPQGFNELDLSVASPIIKESLNAYTRVVGVAPSSVEFFRIIKELNNMYQKEYVTFWKELATNLQVKKIGSTPALRQILDILSRSSDNPISLFYETLAKFTQLETDDTSVVDNANKLTKKLPSALKKVDKAADLFEGSSQKTLLAENITNSFKDYHELVQLNSEGISRLDDIQLHIKDAKIWLDNFYLNSNPSLQAFNILSQALPRNNPVSNLYFYAKQQPELVKNTLQVVTQFIDRSFISMAKNYLNSHWKNFVYTFFKQNLAPFYPFNELSEDDVNITDVKDFFSANGILNNFERDKLRAFRNEVNRRPYLPGLLPETQLVLRSSLWSVIAKGKHIENALGITDSGAASVEFQLKAVDMDNNILNFVITANKPIFTYHHGPAVWRSQVWNGNSVSNDQLSLKVDFRASSSLKEVYKGTWSWFRILSPRLKEFNARQSSVVFQFNQSQVRLLLQVNTKENPFKPGFFSEFILPAAI